MKYNIEMLIVDPNEKTEQVNRHYEIEFWCNSNDYGNGYHVSFNNVDSKGDKQLFDLRYDSNFDKNHPELWIADYVYHNWSGEQESYDVQKLTIERIEE